MNACFIGKMPNFGENNLFSEKPIVAILKTEGPTQKLDGGAEYQANPFKVVCFNTIADARKFRKNHEDPDKAPTTVKIYAFGNGEWKLVSMIADSN